MTNRPAPLARLRHRLGGRILPSLAEIDGPEWVALGAIALALASILIATLPSGAWL